MSTGQPGLSSHGLFWRLEYLQSCPYRRKFTYRDGWTKRIVRLETLLHFEVSYPGTLRTAKPQPAACRALYTPTSCRQPYCHTPAFTWAPRLANTWQSRNKGKLQGVVWETRVPSLTLELLRDDKWWLEDGLLRAPVRRVPDPHSTNLSSAEVPPTPSLFSLCS